MNRGPSLPTNDLEERVRDCVGLIRVRSESVPRVGLTLGSGLGRLIERLDRPVLFHSAELPHWPRSTVAGHAGRLALAHWRSVPVVALSGRSHRYEGYPLDRVTFAVRVMAALGAGMLIF